MKVLLISIDLVLGTRILINVLKGKGFDAKNLQITGIKYSDIFSEEDLKNIYGFCKDYDVIGLSFNSFNSILASQLARYLKSKGVKWLIAGGHHATAMPDEVIEYSDIVVIYEAELTLLKLLERLKADIPLHDLPGIIFKDEFGKIKKTIDRVEIVTNLDNIPFQSFSSGDIAYYDFAKSGFDKPEIYDMFPHGGKNYFILTSRGCPFECSYCCSSLYAKFNKEALKIRKRSVTNIISEMIIAKKAGFKGFYIADDNFLAFSIEELKNFSDIYKSKINLPFSIAGVNPNNMRSPASEKKIDLILSCGLSDIRIGVQSGSKKTLEIFNRKYTAQELPKLLEAFNNRKTIWSRPNDKLRIAVDFICDSPWEDEQDKAETVKLANTLLGTYGIFFYTLTYLPATKIYELALEKGWIEDKEKDIYLRGIGGVEDNIYNRLLYAIGVLKERGSAIPEELLSFILKLNKENEKLAVEIIDFILKVVNDVEGHHALNTTHATMHPYLKGFKEWTKTVGQKGKKVLFRSYHEAYG